MEQRISLITLGVRDLARARAFYEGLGWTTRAAAEDDVVFFQAGGMVVALWDRARLAEDSGVEDSGGWGGATLAHNVRSPAEVDAVIEEARAAGADIVREPAETFWGGYSAAFTDPDGHPWEVAHNPRWTIREDGSAELPTGAAAAGVSRRSRPGAAARGSPGNLDAALVPARSSPSSSVRSALDRRGGDVAAGCARRGRRRASASLAARPDATRCPPAPRWSAASRSRFSGRWPSGSDGLPASRCAPQRRGEDPSDRTPTL